MREMQHNALIPVHFLNQFRSIDEYNEKKMKAHQNPYSHSWRPKRRVGRMVKMKVKAFQQTHLSLREAQCHRQLTLPPHGDVAVMLKLFFQLQTLLITVNHPVFVLSASLSPWVTQKHLWLMQNNTSRRMRPQADFSKEVCHLFQYIVCLRFSLKYKQAGIIFISDSAVSRAVVKHD